MDPTCGWTRPLDGPDLWMDLTRGWTRPVNGPDLWMDPTRVQLCEKELVESASVGNEQRRRYERVNHVV